MNRPRHDATPTPPAANPRPSAQSMISSAHDGDKIRSAAATTSSRSHR